MKPMPAEVFFDSSVLLYILSRTDPKSLAIVASRKLHLEWDRIEDILAEIRELLDPPLALTVSIHELGLAIAHRYKYRIYDSLLIASALEAGCTTLYSEDMQDGQYIGSLTIRNPFEVL
jgi:predicted nucleic acid-binding protein